MTPSRARFTLLRFAFALSVVTYLDRVCIATAATSIRQELRLTAVQMGWVFSAFTLAYAIFEIPSGWLGDTVGPRKVLTRIVLWWSVFTMATGAAWNYVSLLAFRFLFGAGEAGAFPNASRSFSQWFPARERGRAHGIIFMGTRLGGALAPPLAVALIAAIGWRASFWIFGSLGVFWAVLWWRWFRDDPARHAGVNAAELGKIESGRRIDTAPSLRPADFLRLLRNRTATDEFETARRELAAAVDGLRRANRSDYLPRGLLTRAWLRFLTGARTESTSSTQTGPESAQEDLDEAREIAERGPMKLFLADIHLYRARLFGRETLYPWESPHADLAEARRLIEQCGYGRRKEELEDAEAALRQQHS